MGGLSTIINLGEHAEMAGSYTQYQMSNFNGNDKLSSQWLTAVGDPRHAVDDTNCRILVSMKGKILGTKSTMEKIRAGEIYRPCSNWKGKYTPPSKLGLFIIN